MDLILSIIIPTMDRKDILKQSLDYLLEATKHLSVEVIIVNDSKKENLELDNYSVTIINNPKQGVASARNYGLKHAKGEIILFIDDDMLINKLAIDTILNLTESSNKTIYMPDWEYPEDLKKQIEKDKFGRFLNKIGYTSLKGWMGNNLSSKREKETLVEQDGITSQFLMIRKTDFMAIGGYDESFPSAGFEDYDFGKRLLKGGFKFYFSPKLLIYHNESFILKLKDWLTKKQRRNGLTRRIAVENGYDELTLNYGYLKSTFLKKVCFLIPLLLLICSFLPNFFLFDKVYAKLVSLLISYHIYLGYTLDYEKLKN